MEQMQVLSKTKQRRSLSEKKKKEVSKSKRRKSNRTAVVIPGDVEWPDVDEKLTQEILTMIGRSMKCINIPKRKCPLKEIKSVPKGKRAEVRKKWIAQNAMHVGFDMSSYMTKRVEISIGVNCCSMNMECGSLVGLLIEKDVDPQIITKLLVPIAQTRGVPVISLSGLRSAAYKACGIKCIALGFKKPCEMKSSEFFSLCETVKIHAPLDQHLVALRVAAMQDRLFLTQVPNPQLIESIISSCIDSQDVAIVEETTSTSNQVPTVQSEFYIQDEIDKLEKKTALQKAQRQSQTSTAGDCVYIPPKIRKMAPE